MFTAKLWDKKSPINGLPAEDIIRLRGIRGAVGLVICEETQAITYFQYDSISPYTDEQALDIVKHLAQDAIDNSHGGRAYRANEIKCRLEEIDRLSLRCLRAVRATKNAEEDEHILTALENEAVNLRTELKSLKP